MPGYLAILPWVMACWLLQGSGASSSSSLPSTSPTLSPSSVDGTPSISSNVTSSQSSIATWTETYCPTQLQLFDVNHDGTLQESEQAEFFQSMLTSISTIVCTETDIENVEKAMINLCGSNCRFQHTEQEFCTVVAKAMQGHCTEPQNHSTTGTTQNLTTLFFYYTVAFNVSNHAKNYSLQDREQWLIAAFDQLATTTWQSVGINRIYSQQQQQLQLQEQQQEQQQHLRGPRSSRTWISFNQSDMHHRSSNSSNSSSHEWLSLLLSTNITSFQKLPGNDHWNVTHAVELQKTTWNNNNNNRYYPYRLEAFSLSLQSQLPQILWNSLDSILPPGVTLQQNPETAMPTTDTPDSPTQYLQTPPPTSAPTNGMIPAPLAEGLQIWMIVVIAASGAVASGILYLLCFHARPKPISPTSSHLSPTNHDNNNNSNGNSNIHHTPISITVTASSAKDEGLLTTNGLAADSAPDMSNSNNSDNNDTVDMKAILVSTNTLATLDPTPPTTPIRNNISPEQRRSNSIPNNMARNDGPGQNNSSNDQQLEEEKVEEEAARPNGDRRPSSIQNSLTKSSSRNIAYQVDPTGRIVPISFLSDRDSCLHVFEDTSEVYSRRWSSSSSTSSSSSFPAAKRKDVKLQADQQRQSLMVHDDDAGKDTNNHDREQENGNLSPGEEVPLPPHHLSRVVSQASEADGILSPEPMVDESSYYSGVYYGEDDFDDDNDDNNGYAHQPSHLVGSHPIEEGMVDPDVPIYGGVYYGSDGEDEIPIKARSAPHIRSAPMVDYFAGIRIGQNASTSSISTLSRDQGPDGGEEWSVDSRRSRESSLMSAEEREWQRRIREDLLHPVKEDAAIVDTTVVNLSGFTTGPTTTGRGETQRRNRRRKEL